MRIIVKNEKHMVNYGLIENNCVSGMVVLNNTLTNYRNYVNVLGTTIMNRVNVVTIVY